MTKTLDLLLDDLRDHGARPVGEVTKSGGTELAGGEEGIELDIVVEEEEGWVEFQEPKLVLAPPPGQERERVVFEQLPKNRLHAALEALDLKHLTPFQGLRRVTPHGVLEPIAAPPAGKLLLLIHGTFSHGDSTLAALREDPAFFAALASRYDHVLTYDYLTVSRTAIANAMTLARLMRPAAGSSIDVINHSQGALVTRYWLELLAREHLGRSRVVFAGGTLAGTSLAAPWALRGALDYLGNLAAVFKTGSRFLGLGVPAFGAVGQIFAVLQSSLKFMSNAPLLDAGVALVPGFLGMSRVGDNHAIRELRASLDSVPNGYFAVAGAFSPSGPCWKFWDRWKLRMAKTGTDLIFAEEHDLVVDTRSQTSLSDALQIASDRVCAYGPQDHDVHHCNYFAQERTRRFISQVLS